MPDPESINPYAPPEPLPAPRRVRRTPSGVDALTRIIAVVIGFSLLADPAVLPVVAPLANAVGGGRLVARLVGLLVLGAAFLPWRVGTRSDRPPEDL